MELRPNKTKAILLLSFSLIFLVLIVLVMPGNEGFTLWLCFAFFALCASAFVAQLIPGASYLRITSEGFSFRSIFKKSAFFQWSEVSAFRVIRISLWGQKLIVFNSTKASSKGLRSLNRMVAGATDALPDTYGMKAQDLANLMNERSSAFRLPR